MNSISRLADRALKLGLDLNRNEAPCSPCHEFAQVSVEIKQQRCIMKPHTTLSKIAARCVIRGKNRCIIVLSNEEKPLGGEY